MKYLIIILSFTFFALLGGIILFCCAHISSAYKREHQVIDSMLSSSNYYDTITGHLGIYKVMQDTSQQQQLPRHPAQQPPTIEAANYIFAVTISDGSQTYETLKPQSGTIAQTVFKKIMLEDTTKYHFIIVQFFEQIKDTIFSYQYKTANLLYTENL